MSNDKRRNKYLFKNTAIFAIGNFASKFISFFLVPLYTRYITASEYSSVDLLYTLCNFLVPLFTLNIIEGILRFSLDKDADQKKIMRISCNMLFPLAIFGALMIPIICLFNEFRDYAICFYFYMVTLAISQIFLIILKGQEKLKQYSFGNFLHTLLIMVFSLVFLIGLNMGPFGYFLAYIVANIITSIYAIWRCELASNIKSSKFDKKLFKDMVKYSVILIPTTFMWWIMNFLDRAMIIGMIDSAASGVYAVSYKIPTILTSVSSIFLQAWLFSAIKNNDDVDNEKYTNRVFGTLAAILIAVSMILLIFIKQIFNIYVAPEYYIAWEYVPVLMIGHVISTLGTFMSTSYNVNKDSKGFLYSATVGAVINLILNFILIPLIGVQGAAIATTISYAGVFLYRLIDVKKYIKFNLTFRFIASMCLLILFAVSTFFDYWWVIFIQVIIFAVFLIINYVYFGIILHIVKSLATKLF